MGVCVCVNASVCVLIDGDSFAAFDLCGVSNILTLFSFFPFCLVHIGV